MRSKVNSWLQQFEKLDSLEPSESNETQLILKNKLETELILGQMSNQKLTVNHVSHNDFYDSISKSNEEEASHFMSGFGEILCVSQL